MPTQRYETMNIKFRQNLTTRLFDLSYHTHKIGTKKMRKGITLAGSSNAVESPTREGPGAFGTTPSNNEASNVVHLDESKKYFTLNQGFSLNKGDLCLIMWSNVISWLLFNTQGRQESPGLVYTRSSFSGDSSSCGYNEFKSNSQEVASQKSKDTDPRIRSSSSSRPTLEL